MEDYLLWVYFTWHSARNSKKKIDIFQFRNKMEKYKAQEINWVANSASNEQKQPILDLYNSHIEQITYTKTPIEGHYGEFRIKGVQFEDEEGTVGFEAYAKQKRGYTLISSMGYPFDSPVAVGVICAVKIDGIMDNITPRPDSE